jgi:hypothetical protein
LSVQEEQFLPSIKKEEEEVNPIDKVQQTRIEILAKIENKEEIPASIL